MHIWLVLHFFKWDAHPCIATSPRIWMLVTKHDQHLGRSIIFTYLHHIFRKTNCFFCYLKDTCLYRLIKARMPTLGTREPSAALCRSSNMAEAKSLRSVRNWQCLGARSFCCCGNMGRWWHGSTRTISPMLGILIKNDMLMIFDDFQQHGIVLLFAVSISIQ